MDTTKTFIALDIGTSYIKGAVLDLASFKIRHIQRRPFPQPVDGLPPNYFEMDPFTLVNEVQSLVASLLAEAPNAQGMVTTTQMHGLVLANHDYQPLSNIITWRDQRAVAKHPLSEGSYYDQLLAQLTAAEQRELGNGLRAGLPICTLYCHAEEGQLPDEPAIPLTLSEYVLAALCDGPVQPAIEPTNAAAYGAYHVGNRTWHTDVLQRLGLDGLRWPEVGTIRSVVGHLDASCAKIPVYTSVGDHQCALMGAFLQNGELSLNVATGSQASLITPTLALGDHETRPYFDERYLNTLVKIPAGRSLDLLVSLLTEVVQTQVAQTDGEGHIDPWRVITQAVEQVAETDLGIDLSFYDSAAASAGSISNIREDNFSVGHLFRAAFQSMAQNYVDAGKLLAGDNVTWERLVFSGGLVQKLDPLRQTILDAFGSRGLQSSYRICAEEEDTLLGLMVLAYCISGNADSVADATRALASQLG